MNHAPSLELARGFQPAASAPLIKSRQMTIIAQDPSVRTSAVTARF